MLSAGRRESPTTPEGTSTWRGPAAPTAATSTRSTSAPASTGPVRPSSTTPLPVRVTCTSRRSPPVGSNPARVAPGHQVATVSPATRPGRCLWWMSVPERARAPATTFVASRGPGAHVAPHLLRDESEVCEGTSGDTTAPELLGHEHRDPAELRALAPPSPVEAAGLVLREAAHRVEWTGVVEEFRRRLAQQLLVFGQRVVHDQPVRTVGV